MNRTLISDAGLRWRRRVRRPYLGLGRRRHHRDPDGRIGEELGIIVDRRLSA